MTREELYAMKRKADDVAKALMIECHGKVSKEAGLAIVYLRRLALAGLSARYFVESVSDSVTLHGRVTQECIDDIHEVLDQYSKDFNTW